MDHGHLSFAQARGVFVLAAHRSHLMRFGAIPPVDEAIRAAAYRRLDVLTKPRGALGQLEPLAAQVCAIQGTLDIRMVQPMGIVFAADHGVADRGVSAYPREVTAQMVANFLHGGAAISVLAKLQGVDLWIVDAGVDSDCRAHPRLIEAKIRRGTRNFIDEPAMTPEECAEALQRGRDVVERVMPPGSNALVLGEMGIGNTAAAASGAGIWWGGSRVLVGRGSADKWNRGGWIIAYSDIVPKSMHIVRCSSILRFNRCSISGCAWAKAAAQPWRSPSCVRPWRCSRRWRRSKAQG